MTFKRILIVSLTLVTSLFVTMVLVNFPVSLAAGPPTETPPGVKPSYPLSFTTTIQTINQPTKAVRATSASSPALRLSIASLGPSSSNNNGWRKVITENFEGGFPPPNCFIADTSSADGGEYLWGQRDCKSHSGNYSIWAGGGGSGGQHIACGQPYTNSLYTWLVCGPYDLGDPITDAEVQFALWGDIEEFLSLITDTVFWGVSTDTLHFYGLTAAGQTGAWIPESLNLTEIPTDDGSFHFIGEPQVYLGWHFQSNAFNLFPPNPAGAFIDDTTLWVYEPPSSPPSPAPATPPITIHTTITDFSRGRSNDVSVFRIAGGNYGNGALVPAARLTTIGNWERLPSLSRELLFFDAVIVRNHLFVIGGNSPHRGANDPDGGYQRRVYSALINQDGHLGHWQETTPLPVGLAGHQVVVANNHIFVLGGVSIYGPQSTVFRAQINDDGTLSQWTDLSTTTPLPKPSVLHTAVSVNGYIYVLGGTTSVPASSGSALSNIIRARVNANGTLSGWETLPTTLPHPLYLHATVATCNHLYLLGGQDELNEWANVYQAEIQADASLGAWSQTTSLPKTMVAHAAVAVHGGILVTGGFHSSDPVFNSQKNVYWAPVDSNCALDNWTELAPLPYNIDTHTLAVTDDHIYNLGGLNAAGIEFASVFMAPLQLDNRPVRYETFNHQFHLDGNHAIETLRWTEEGNGDMQVSLRYRVADANTGTYGPWSNYSSINPITVDAYGGSLEYQLRLIGESGLNDKWVSEISIGTSPQELKSVYLPIVLKN